LNSSFQPAVTTYIGAGTGSESAVDVIVHGYGGLDGGTRGAWE